jgi:hypothetical protein
VSVSVPSVAWQVYVPVPEVSYPVSATIVHDCPAARVFAPTVQSPVASPLPRAGIVQEVACAVATIKAASKSFEIIFSLIFLREKEKNENKLKKSEKGKQNQCKSR